MDDKVNYSLVGAFVLVLGAALVAGILWLAAGVSGKKQYEPYQSIMRETVSGLNVDAPVKYLGVDVGKVNDIRIDPQNSRQVRLGLMIERGTPIKQDSEAVLKTQGVTGIAYVELSGGSEGSPPLVAGHAGEVPNIPSKASLSARLENVATTVLTNVGQMSTKINGVLDDENRAALKQVLADMALLSQALAAQQRVISAGIASAARAADNTARASAQLGPAIDRIATSAAAVEAMARSADSASVRAGLTVDAATLSVRQLNAQTLPELERALAEVSLLASSLRRLGEQTERHPNSLLLGAPVRAPGPGERATR